METTQTLIRNTVLISLSFLSQGIVKNGLILAFEDALSDLKGLIPPDSFCEVQDDGTGSVNVEFELLSILEDPFINAMVNTVYKIDQCNGYFKNIYNIEVHELAENEEAYWLASDLVDAILMDQGEVRMNFVKDWGYNYCNYQMLIWILAQLQLQNTVDMTDDMVTDYFDNYDAISERRYVVEDSFAQKLIDLIGDVSEDEQGIE